MSDDLNFEITPKINEDALNNIQRQITNKLTEAAEAGLRKQLGIMSESQLQEIEKKKKEDKNNQFAFSRQVGAVAGGASHGLTSALGAISPGIGSAVGVIESFVSKVNPAVVDKLNLAFEDIQAVIGKALTPVLGALVPIVRTIGDFLATMLPLLDPLVKWITLAVTALGEFVRLCLELISNFATLLATGESSQSSSVGAAFRQAQYVDIAQSGADLAQAAFSSGNTSGPASLADDVKAIRDFVDTIVKFFTGDKSKQQGKVLGDPGFLHDLGTLLTPSNWG